ncbi:coatomer epsilon subunit-domain-containing protein, partial [Blyttiomyces helicus]
DELAPLRNRFYAGSHQQVIAEATNPATVPRSDTAKLERRILLHRAYLAQGRFALVLTETGTGPTEPAEIRAVRALARVAAARAAADWEAGHRAVEEARPLLEEGGHVVQVLVGTAMCLDGDYEGALGAVVRSPRNLECVALATQIYLKLDRPDLARKEVEKLKTWADDASLAQLIEAWVNSYSGGEAKYQESFYIFEELASSLAPTSRLLTSEAVCRMQTLKFAEAEQLLLTALNQNPNDPEALANLVICSKALGKPDDVASLYMNQLKDASPAHIFVQELDLKSSLFDRCAQRWGV